jgi:hypothetical protein
MQSRSFINIMAVLSMTQVVAINIERLIAEGNHDPLAKQLASDLTTATNAAFNLWNDPLERETVETIAFRIQCLSTEAFGDRDQEVTIYALFSMGLIEDFIDRTRGEKYASLITILQALCAIRSHFDPELEAHHYDPAERAVKTWRRLQTQAPRAPMRRELHLGALTPEKGVPNDRRNHLASS